MSHLEERRQRLKLRITIDGKTYEAEVEILEDEESEHPYVPYTPAPVSYTPPPFPCLTGPASAIDTSGDGGKVCRSPVTGLVINGERCSRDRQSSPTRCSWCSRQ